MSFFPPSIVRPCNVLEVTPPAIVLHTANYGAPLLILGEPDDATVVFLGGQFQFQSFDRAKAENWRGLAIENIHFEVDLDSAVDLSGFARAPGMVIRRDEIIAFAAIADGPFRRTIEVAIQSGLPGGSDGLVAGFTRWRVFIELGEEERTLWEYSPPDPDS